MTDTLRAKLSQGFPVASTAVQKASLSTLVKLKTNSIFLMLDGYV